MKQIGKLALVGKTREGYGYVAVGSLGGSVMHNLQLRRAFEALPAATR